MEPVGSVRWLRYVAVIHGRVPKRLRKRHRPPVGTVTEPMSQSEPMTFPIRARVFALLVSLALATSACGPATPSATPSIAPTTGPSTTAPSTTPPNTQPSDADAIYDTIEAQVVAIRGLSPTQVERKTIDGDALKAFQTGKFDEDNPPDYVAANERLYKAFGLLDPDQSLKQLFLDLIGSQVAGFYRPDEKALYVVSRTGTINGADRITFAHEYDHALQDANFDVFADQKGLLDETDRALARAAMYEGDATLLMVVWAGANMTPDEFAEVQAAGTNPESVAVLERTPAILVESLLFPYTAGQAFILPIQTAGGWSAVDDLYDDLPRSTEQILHPDKYRSGEEPVAVQLPATLAADMDEGWTETAQDTFGEFQLGVWLRESGLRASDAAAAAAGWGGDRLAVLNGPDESWAVVMRSTWDTDADASAFQQAAGEAVADGPNAGTVIADGRDITIVFASSGDVLDTAVSAAGYGAGT